MTIPLLATLAATLSLYISPADSCRNRLELSAVPEEALLFAELAARQGGDGPILYARVLELAGRFEEAATAYGIALGGAEDGATRSWLADRRAGSIRLDTLILLTASVTNAGDEPLSGLELGMPLPRPHPPYQDLRILYGPFREEDGRLLCRPDPVPPGCTVEVPLMIHVVQEPFTFRPLSTPPGGPALEDISELASRIGYPDIFSGPGPCLDMAVEFRDRAAAAGLEARVEGGLVRQGDSLVFHAWNILLEGIPGLPVDPLMHRTDSLRSIGHCPCDVIPLWDLGASGGHELSVSRPGSCEGVSIGLSAAFSAMDRDNVLFRLLEAAPDGFLPFFTRMGGFRREGPE